MGAIASRQNAGVEEADVISNYAYKYPPRSGNFFGNHFIMGGERFDTPQPEAYLFGENADLNFLGSRPTPFPYPPPQSNEPTKTLRSLVNIRKESLRFVRCPEPVGKMMESSKPGDDEMKASDGKGTYYNIEFTFDCDVRCSITIYYFCTEELTPNGVVYYPRDPTMTSQTYHYKKGANQQFCQLSHVLDPSKYAEEDLLFHMEKEIIPIAIYCQVDEGQEEMRQSHTTIAVVERHTDGTYVLKALKQKLFVDGLCYLLQEIYGIENKNLDTKINTEDDAEESGSECVICMCDVRDTLILPCRHLCLCNSCADSLRYQANNCPICRAPFRALLQIRALQKTRTTSAMLPGSPPDGSMEHIPPGYEAVSLVEALNGAPPPAPRPPAPAPLAAPPAPGAAAAASLPTHPVLPDTAAQAAEALNRGSVERTSTDSLKRGKEDKARGKHKPATASTPSAEFRMSVLLAREEDSSKRSEEKHASSPLLEHHNHNGTDVHVKVSLDADTLEGETGTEADSDAERKSPLLPPHVTSAIPKCNGSVNGLQRDTSLEMPPHAHIDEAVASDTAAIYTNSDVQSRSSASSPPIAEDSDYFTPEDTSTTILTVPKVATMLCDPQTTECIPQRWTLPNHVTSLPGTPLSASSVRSSGESYSSNSSTKQLLAPRAAAAAAAPTGVTDTLC